MDLRDNPSTPNAGAGPPALVGREDELAAFDFLLARLARGSTDQSVIVTGLRGVGKTVLLGELRIRAEAQGWIAIEAEITRHLDFGLRMAQPTRRALLQLAPKARWKDRARRAAGVLKSFTITVSSNGALTPGSTSRLPKAWPTRARSSRISPTWLSRSARSPRSPVVASCSSSTRSSIYRESTSRP